MIESIKNLNRKKEEKAVLIALIDPFQKEETVNDYIAELAFLATTMGIKTQNTFTQKLDKPDSRSFVGKDVVVAKKQHSMILDISP